jgi:opacity protein-like surface antigen
MFSRKLLCGVALLLVVVASAGAQDYFGTQAHVHAVEITPFGGTRFGGTIDLNSGPFSQLDIRSSWDYGASLDVGLIPHLQAEFMWDHQPTVLDGVSFSTGAKTRVSQANLDFYHWGILVPFLRPDAKIQPYVAGGLGFTHFNAHNSAGQVLPFDNRFSFNVGGGVKYFVVRNFGLRLDVRYSPTHTTSSVGIFCDPFFGCFAAEVPNYAHQGEANIGLIFRF